MRRVPSESPTFEELGLPAIVRRLANEEKGLILVTGPSGSGKSSTMAAIVDHINSTRPVSIITVEDPIEILHPDKLAIVAQREVGVDTSNFADAVERAVRQDADVIVISHIADYETARGAIGAAETGHLVISSMHTVDPSDTITRLVGYFPSSEQALARRQLAAHLRVILSQRLLETSDGGSRVLATELLTNNERVRERLLDPNLTSTIDEVMKESEFFGMHTFDQTLQHLVLSRRDRNSLGPPPRSQPSRVAGQSPGSRPGSLRRLRSEVRVDLRPPASSLKRSRSQSRFPAESTLVIPVNCPTPLGSTRTSVFEQPPSSSRW